MSLSCLIGHVGYDHEIEEHRILAVCEHHWHLYLERTIVIGHHLTAKDLFVP